MQGAESCSIVAFTPHKYHILVTPAVCVTSGELSAWLRLPGVECIRLGYAKCCIELFVTTACAPSSAPAALAGTKRRPSPFVVRSASDLMARDTKRRAPGTQCVSFRIK